MELEPGKVVDKLKGLVKSTQDFFIDGINQHGLLGPGRQIEIMKRLLREAFSDLMKLRDRQEKVERLLSSCKSSRGSPFQESCTHVRGEIDLSAALMMADVDQENYNVLSTAGVRAGIDSRIMFETSIMQRDTLVAEFKASQKGLVDMGNLGSSLSLAKVLYVANISDWLSVVAVPVGAQCRDVGTATGDSHQQEEGFTNLLSYGPPILNQHRGSGIGLTVSKSNVTASLAQFVSAAQKTMPGSVSPGLGASTFGQVACQLFRGTKLSLLGLHHASKATNQWISARGLGIPVDILKQRGTPAMKDEENGGNGSIAVLLESRVAEITQLKCWVETEQPNPRCLRYALRVTDSLEDEFGFGLGLAGTVRVGPGPARWESHQLEAFMKLNLGKGFSLQPGVVHAINGETQVPALMLRSTWSL